MSGNVFESFTHRLRVSISQEGRVVVSNKGLLMVEIYVDETGIRVTPLKGSSTTFKKDGKLSLRVQLGRVGRPPGVPYSQE